jgi:hypothetical protein
VDNFTDGAGDVIWTNEEKEERATIQQEYEREVQELER